MTDSNGSAETSVKDDALEEPKRPKMRQALILGGGGVKGISTLGALYVVWQRGETFDVLAGSSVGFMECALLCMGLEPMEIFDEVYKMEHLFSMGDVNALGTMLGSLSIININVVRERLLKIIRSKWSGDIPTLKQLHEISGKILLGTTVNSDTGQLVYLSHESHPELSVLDAMLMSCALPGVFSPLVYEGAEYVDGGLLDNFPVKEVNRRWPDADCFGIVLDSEPYSGSMSIVQKRVRLMFLPVNRLTSLSIETGRARVLRLTVPVSIIEFYMPSVRKMELFLVGCKGAERFFSTAGTE